MNHPRTLAAACVATLLFALAAQPAAAVCTPSLCYIDLAAGGGAVCPNSAVFTLLQSHPVLNTMENPACNAALWRAVVARVQVPNDCAGVDVSVEYDCTPPTFPPPEGFTVNIGDSETNNGFGGDAGSLPTGQNAEVQILDEDLTVYGAGGGALANQTLSLVCGSIKAVVRDQFVRWSPPSIALSTSDQLFFLPPGPLTPPENRAIYVGLNRVVDPIGGQATFRNGCGARRAFLVLQ